MAEEKEDLSKIKDVSYLLTRLRVARLENDADMEKAILNKVRDLGIPEIAIPKSA